MAGEHLRAKFEQWATGELTRLNITRYPEDHMYAGQYTQHDTATAWAAWRRAFHVAKNE